MDHDDREIEFHDLQHQVRMIWMTEIAPVQEAGEQSCETMARRLGEYLVRAFSRPFTVIVSEDNECGAEVRVASDDR